MASTLSAVRPDTLDVLKNKEILAINQDDVIGKSISPFRWGINVSILSSMPPSHTSLTAPSA
ncbi:hypothetical protein C0989_010146 [Termitomyces sp. Mn162]|nr:hypothetical protein C0989_010146 [Termitomyces sp. Mn162]